METHYSVIKTQNRSAKQTLYMFVLPVFPPSYYTMDELKRQKKDHLIFKHFSVLV